MVAAGVGLAASFTCSKILTEALEFWLERLGIDDPLHVAGYSQIFNVIVILRIPCGCRQPRAYLGVRGGGG